MNYAHIAAKLYGTPWLIDPAKAQILEQVFRAHVSARMTGEPVEVAAIEAKQHVTAPPMKRADGGYQVTDGGVAVLQVHGTLVQRTMGLDALSGLTSYGSIGQQLQTALADPKVRGIVLEIDSPGGEAAGVWDLAAQIMNASKPVVAHANEMAFSAAYALASAAQDGLYLPESGMVGSVGVIMLHVDQSQLDSKRGLVYTPIFAGSRKADFSSHAPLSDRARATAQEGVDHLYEIFVDHVAAARAIGPDVVKATEAGHMRPGQAIDIGMADGIASFAEAVQTMQDRVSAPSFTGYSSTTRRAGAYQPTKGTTTMEAKDKNAPANTAATSEQQIESARAEGLSAGKAEGAKEGVGAERARVAGILTHAEAAGRTKLAEHLAFKTDSTVEAAAAMLAAAPKEVAVKNALAEAMSGVPNPQVGADGAESGEKKVVAPNPANIYAFRQKCVADSRR